MAQQRQCRDCGERVERQFDDLCRACRIEYLLEQIASALTSISQRMNGD